MALTERRAQIYLSEEQYRAATRLARQRGSSLAAVIREALDRHLATAVRGDAAPWVDDPAAALLASLALPPLAAGDDLDGAIDRSVYGEV
jgi:hypothetical protein